MTPDQTAERIATIRERVQPNWIGGTPVGRSEVRFLLERLAQVEAERDELRAKLESSDKLIDEMHQELSDMSDD